MCFFGLTLFLCGRKLPRMSSQGSALAVCRDVELTKNFLDASRDEYGDGHAVLCEMAEVAVLSRDASTEGFGDNVNAAMSSEEVEVTPSAVAINAIVL